MSPVPLESRIPIISHWGITGGNFHEIVGADIRNEIDLSFIQTCFSFNDDNPSRLGSRIFEAAKAKYPEKIKVPADIRSPVGFIHGYDLTKLLLAALEKAELSGDITSNRNHVRLALEDLNEPVPGLIKTYQNPFQKFSPANEDAHEALGAQDLCMGIYGPNDEISIMVGG